MICLEWLEEQGYLEKISRITAWDERPDIFKLNWKTVKDNLGIPIPQKLKPLETLVRKEKTKKTGGTLISWIRRHELESCKTRIPYPVITV